MIGSYANWLCDDYL
uniref:Uncharacterized protein n=1 Tax=Anguilla anguilla TaxID=7936 RepID=A0A0E9UHU4_ANGAN